MKSRRASLLGDLARSIPSGEFSTEESARKAVSGDKWHASALPDAVATPKSAETISLICKFASEHRIPITPRGAGYGYVGGCVPNKGGIVLSLMGLNRILEINPDDFVAVAQPGVITAKLQEAVERKGLYYPPDPASRADCSIGGNIATNAGGPRCLKYGVTSEYVLGLQVVLSDGRIVRVGGRTHKNKTGFDFTKFFVGSEGMLGLVTEATLKLLPLPPYRAALAIGCSSTANACAVIKRIFSGGFLPSALELADSFTLRAARKRTGSKLLEGCDAHLIVELDGQEKSVRGEVRELEKLVQKAKPLFVRKGFGPEGCERFWQLRREFSYSLRDTGLTKLNEDIVVPRGRLRELFAFTDGLEKKHGLPVAAFGHAGDGNIHVNIMVDTARPDLVARQEAVLDELFEKVIALGGAVTGEHGIGLAKKRWWPLAVSEEVNELHRAAKRAFDPAGILNPGKFLDR